MRNSSRSARHGLEPIQYNATCYGPPRKEFWLTTMQALDEDPKVQTPLYRLSPEEFALVLAFRECCAEHRLGVIWFAKASASGCTGHLPSNVCRFIKPK